MEASPTEKRIDDLSGRVGRFEDRFERFEDKVDARFDRVDERFDKVDGRFEKVDERFDQTATKEDIARIEARLDRWGKVVTSGVIAISGSVVTVACGAFLKLLGV
jgi:hypothetical protein